METNIKNDFIVYMHILPNNKKYIGVTSQKTYQRWHGGNAYKFNKELTNDIKKYGWNNIEHIIIKNNLTKNEAYGLEQDLIKKYKTTNKKYGYNKQNGGEKNKNTDEIKKKISESHKDKILSEDTKKKLREQKLGEKNPMFNKKPVNCRKVIQFNLNNKIIKVWNDIHEAEKELKIFHSNIIKCCKKERNTAGNYIWRYYDE